MITNEKTSNLIQPTVAAYDQTAAGERSQGSLVVRYGPLINGEALWKALGYRSNDALRQARKRGSVPVAVFPIAGRKGLFSRTDEVESWLASLPTTGEASRPVGKPTFRDHEEDDVPID
jgi:hypothetical protein